MDIVEKLKASLHEQQTKYDELTAKRKEILHQPVECENERKRLREAWDQAVNDGEEAQASAIQKQLKILKAKSGSLDIAGKLRSLLAEIQTLTTDITTRKGQGRREIEILDKQIREMKDRVTSLSCLCDTGMLQISVNQLGEKIQEDLGQL